MSQSQNRELALRMYLRNARVAIGAQKNILCRVQKIQKQGSRLLFILTKHELYGRFSILEKHEKDWGLKDHDRAVEGSLAAYGVRTFRVITTIHIAIRFLITSPDRQCLRSYNITRKRLMFLFYT
jgi:hypothetical protein